MALNQMHFAYTFVDGLPCGTRCKFLQSESDEEPLSGDDRADESEDEEATETAADKRLRIGKNRRMIMLSRTAVLETSAYTGFLNRAYVQDLRTAAEAEEETDEDEDNEGNRDSRVSEHLRKSLVTTYFTLTPEYKHPRSIDPCHSRTTHLVPSNYRVQQSTNYDAVVACTLAFASHLVVRSESYNAISL
eukprot:5815997-Pyramimonas_sp.AAC.1